MSAESSKNGAKRGKKQQLHAIAAAIAARRQAINGNLRITSEDSNSPSQQSPIVESDSPRVSNETNQESPSKKTRSKAKANQESPKKKTRGKAKCLVLSKGKGKKNPLQVHFNHIGVPYRENAGSFSSFLGITAKDMLPVNVEGWRELAKAYKNRIWEYIQQKFIVGESHKGYVFRKLSKHWRDHRSNLLKQVREKAKEVGLRKAAAFFKPSNIESLDEWLAFIKKRNTPAQLAISEKFRQMRAKQTLRHRTSRKSFARLEDELRQQSETPDDVSRADVWIEAYQVKKKKKNDDGEEVEDPEIVKQVKRLREERSSSSIKDDVVSKVLGPEPRGRVRGLGFGATPSKVEGQIYMRDRVISLENEVQGLRGLGNEVQALRSLIHKLIAQLDNRGNDTPRENMSVLQHSVYEGAQSKGNNKRITENSEIQILQSKEPSKRSVEDSEIQISQSKESSKRCVENSTNQTSQSKRKENTCSHNSATESAQNKRKKTASVECFANEKSQSKEKENRHNHSPIESTQRKRKNTVSVEKLQSKEKENGHIQSFRMGGRVCDLLNWMGTTDEVVATAKIASTDPNALAHFVPIGQDCWKVWVINCLDNDINLYRPTSEIFYLRDAVGVPIAWPIKFIKLH